LVTLLYHISNTELYVKTVVPVVMSPLVVECGSPF